MPELGTPANWQSRSNALREQAAALLAEAGHLDRAKAEAEIAAREAAKPVEPEVTVDQPAFVTFRKYLSGREYTYAAVGWRVGRSVRWAITSRPAERANWPALLQFIGEANWPTLRTLVEGDQITGTGGAGPVVEQMGAYGTVTGSSPGASASPFAAGGLMASGMLGGIGYGDSYRLGGS